jgi:gamma-glutamyltranspeptidase/glutathione hydrolase
MGSQRRVAAGVAASHPVTAEVGIQILRAGGTAADAAVASVLTCCVAETIYTGLGGGGFGTYFDAATGEITCLDFFASVPGTDGDRQPGPMIAVDVFFGGMPQVYSIGGASVAVPGVPWGRWTWPRTGYRKRMSTTLRSPSTACGRGTTSTGPSTRSRP